ncbi:hypothetical protein F5Y09DRAFT_338630 [Xylaria sp. FL1042]|nr:hypothetical protein F5Y09DRAFT_338630 [Xylaria sp. FL1042]
MNETTLPWEWEGAEKYPTFDDLMVAITNELNTTTNPPFNLLRSFHPKGTAYSEHERLIFAAMADNGDSVPGGSTSGNYSERCRDWDI